MDDLNQEVVLENQIEDEIICALIKRNDYRSLILSKVKIDDFDNQENRIIFHIIQKFTEENVVVDIGNIQTQLLADNSEIATSAINHLYNDIMSIGYVDNIDSKMQILINKSTKNKIDKLAKNILETNINLLDPDENFYDWAVKLDQAINSRNIGDIELIKTAVDLYQQNLLTATNNNGELTGTTSGYEGIDEFTNGFQKGDLIILAARPSIGKTALAINFMLNAAKEIHDPKQAIVFFSLEMSKEQIIQRMVTNLASIDGNLLRTGQIDDQMKKAINANLDRLKQYPIFIEDKPNMNILEIESRLRGVTQTHEVKLVVLDYLQLIESTSHSYNRVQEVGKISRKLKIMARELNVPIIAIAQLSRKIEERKNEDRRPMLSDLRESGSIEQDADLVTFIDYDRNQIDNKSIVANKGTLKNSQRVEVIFYIEKHRNGMTGQVKLWFNKHEGRFISYSNHSKNIN